MRIEIGSDHRGYELKERCIAWLVAHGHEAIDHGCRSKDSCDYPDHALTVARAVAANPEARGILICSNGVGMTMVANKVAGIRAALCTNTDMASQSRRHNDANVLALGADIVSTEENLRIVEVWLEAAFEGGRHTRRVAKIMAADCGGETGPRSGG